MIADRATATEAGGAPVTADPLAPVANDHSERRPGRPRDERADRAIIAATLEIFADEGYHALSIEAVAAKAEVSKATVYRRRQGKRQLVIDALATLNDDLPEFVGDDTRERLLQAMAHMANKDAGSLAGRIMPRMLVYSVSQPDLYAEYFDRVILPRRRRLRAVLLAGVADGELRADLDVDTAVLAIVGPVLLQSHSIGGHPPHSDLPQSLLAIIWPGMVAHPTTVD
jgi:AcrR family transcriptional regulator